MAALLARKVDEFTERSFCVPIPLNLRSSILLVYATWYMNTLAELSR